MTPPALLDSGGIREYGVETLDGDCHLGHGPSASMRRILDSADTAVDSCFSSAPAALFLSPLTGAENAVRPQYWPAALRR